MQPDLRVRFFVPVYLALNNQFTRVTKQQAEALLPVHNGMTLSRMVFRMQVTQ